MVLHKVIWLALLGLIASPNGLNGGFNLPPAAQPSSPLTPPLPPPICATLYITVIEKKVAQNSEVYVSYTS